MMQMPGGRALRPGFQPQQHMTAFRTKRDVDQHVELICRQDLSEKERSLRYYSIARAYASVREFPLAKRFLQSYIEANPTSPGLADAYKVMGDILTDTREHEAALESYKKSYDITPTRITLNRICDLLANGFGEKETPEARNAWFTKQKTASSQAVTESSMRLAQQRPEPLMGYTFPVSQGSSPGQYFHTMSPTVPVNFNGQQDSSQQQRTTPQRPGSARGQGDITPRNLLSQLQPQVNGTQEVETRLKQLELKANQQLEKCLERMNQQFEKVMEMAQQEKGKIGSQQKLNGQGDSGTHKLEQSQKLVENKLLEIQKEMIQKLQQVQVSIETKIDCGFYKMKKEMNEELGQAQKNTASVMESMQKSVEKNLQEFIKAEQCKMFKDYAYPLLDQIDAKQSSASKVEPKPAPVPVAQSKLPEQPKAALSDSKLRLTEPKLKLEESKPKLAEQTKQPEPVKPLTEKVVKEAENLSKMKIAEAKATPAPSVPAFTFRFNTPATTEGGFHALAKAAESNTGFGLFNPSSSTPKTSDIFSQPIGPIFGVRTPTSVAESNKTSDADHDESAEEFEPTAEFTPVIPLPPLVEVVKGDENENVVYEVRAKLLRLHEDEKEGKKEWKERGLGNIKILQDKDRPTKVRVVMWREQIHKLACNHRILKDTKIEFFNNSDKSLMWVAIDFADGEQSEEIFVCKFGKPEQCKTFKEHVDRLVELINNSPDEEASPVAASKIPEQPKPKEVSVPLKPLSELFKKPEGTWTCNACYVQNKPDVLKCASCETLKPGVDPSSIKNDEAISSSKAAPAPFTFGFTTPQDGGFQSLAKSAAGGGFTFGGTGTNIFSKPITPMFGTPASTTSADTSKTDADHDESAEEFEPTAEFTPVIPLPPLVEVVKGDENENVVYEVRAKLLRLHEDEKEGKKEWKERGLGNIKILQDKDRPTKVRVVMWREQIHKLACNHRILKDTKIDFFNNSDKSLMWVAIDFADGEQSEEIFVCKFGKPEQCKTFKDHIDRLVELINNSPVEETTPVAASKLPESKSVEATKPVPVQTPLSELFKKPEGTWTCNACYVQNKPDELKCVSCETVKPGVDPSSIKKVEAISTTTTSAAPFASQFTFGFNTPTEGGLGGFQALAKKAEGEGGTGFTFGASTGSNIFSKPITPIFGTPTAAPETSKGDGDHDESAEEFVPTAEFTPVIPLPPLVEVVKGDENENTVYEVRAKLLRLHEDEKDGKKEWKERGLGNIKILQDKDRPTKVRVVMWREQIHKLACNHRILKDTKIDFFNNSDKSLMWVAIDFADGEQSEEIFVCKFGKPEQCKTFKEHIERLVALINNSPEEPSPVAASKVPEPKLAEVSELVKPLSELFKKPEGTWTCDACYVQNKPDVLKCASCETLKPGVDPSSIKKDEAISSSKAAPPVPQFSFGFNPANVGGSQSQPSLALAPSASGFTFGGTGSTGANIFSKPAPPVFGFPPAVDTGVATKKESPITSQVPEKEECSTSCTGCIGCDPDKFDFSKLENRKVAEDYPEQKMTPEEFKKHNEQKSKDKLAAFSFSFPSTTAPAAGKAPESKSTGGIVPAAAPPVPVFSGFGGTNSFAAPTLPVFQTPVFGAVPAPSFAFGSSGSSFSTPPTAAATSTPTASALPQPPVPDFSSKPLSTPPRTQAPYNVEDSYNEYDEYDDDDPVFEGVGKLRYRKHGESEMRELGLGLVCLSYDSDIYCNRFTYLEETEDTPAVDHVICADTQLNATGDKEFYWTALMESDSGHMERMELEVTFDNNEIAADFMDRWSDSTDMASQANMTEAYLEEEGE